MQVFGKTQDNLWTLVAAPTIWGFHFLFSYFLAAYRCAPNDDVFRCMDLSRAGARALPGILDTASRRALFHRGGLRDAAGLRLLGLPVMNARPPGRDPCT